MPEPTIVLGRGDVEVSLLARFGNRHGLVTGATGTGKTVTVKLLAEGFSRLGVPVFAADVKGDLAGLAMPGEETDRLRERLRSLGVAGWAPAPNPVVFWDLDQSQGHPLRTTVSEVGPLLLSRMLDLSEAQAGALDVAFAVADAEGLLLLDLEDLRALLQHLIDEKDEISRKFGLVSPQSVAAIQRALLGLSRDGGERFFGEPALDLADLLRQDLSGAGIVNVLAADALLTRPRLYATALLWLLAELFEELPEVGDLPLPKLVFFFDEAHLLFADAPKVLVDKVEQVVRLVRSKGVGVWFCTQSPADLPDAVLGQLGNRVQHALRAATPREQKAVRVAAETFVPNPKLDVVDAIGRLAVGEALVSTLDAKGSPTPVERVAILPPRSRFGALTSEERDAVRRRSPVGGKYDAAINRESAHEMLARRAEAVAPPPREAAPPRSPAPSRRESPTEAFVKSTLRSIGSQVGRQIVRGILGSLSRRR